MTAHTDVGPRPGSRAQQVREALGRTVAIAAVYTLLAFLVWLFIPKGSGSVVSFWPVAGYAVGCTVIWGRRAWAGLLLGAILAAAIMLSSAPELFSLQQVLFIALVNAIAVVLQSSAAELLIQQAGGFARALTADWKIVRMLLLAGPLAATVAATINVVVLLAIGVMDAEQALPAWLGWWAGDAAGIVIGAPLTIALVGIPGDTSRADFRRQLGAPLLVALVLMMVSMHGVVRLEQRESRLGYERLMDSISQYARGRVHGYLDTLGYLRALFDSSDDVGQSEFRNFARVLREGRRDIRALEWIPAVAGSDRAAFEHRMASAMGRDFRLTEFDVHRSLVPVVERELHFPITFVEPVPGNEPVSAFDVASFPRVAAAILRARDTGKPMATAARRLVQEPGDSLGIIIYAPVYESAGDPGSVAERRETFRGVVALVLHVREFMASMASRFALQDMAVQFVDTDGSGSGRTLYTVPNDRISVVSASLVDAIRVPVGDRVWEIRILATPSLFTRKLPLVNFLWQVSVVIGTLLLSAWFLSTVGRQSQMEIAVADRTFQLRKTLRAVEDNPSMIMITDARGIIEYVNPKFTEVTGYQSARVIGHPALEFLSDRPSALRMLVRIRQQLASRGNWRGDIRSRSRQGEQVWIEAHVSPLRDTQDRITHFIVNLEDVSERRKLAAQLSHQAHHDALTGLMNRAQLEQNLERVIVSARIERSDHALCFLDLDQFKVVNDTCGHVAGDELLRQVGALLKSHVRRTDSLARFGGDEFVLLMETCPLHQANRVAEQILAAMEKFRFTWESKSFSVGVCIGVVPIDESTASVTEVLQKADAACYAAKDAGRGRVHVFRPDDSELARRQGEMHWVAEINRAVEHNLFCLFGQPIVPVDGGSGIAHYELLVRMKRDDGNLVPPGNFLSAAERYNLSRKIDRWVVSNALGWLSERIRTHGDGPMISINLSGSSFSGTAFREFVFDEIRACGVPAELICFEITETAAVANLTDAQAFIDALRRFGCRFALDDFGSGLSSFAYLKNFPIDYLKIDGYFVKDIDTDPIDAAMVRSINDVGHEMGKKTIAEYVENDRILAVLRDIGVDFAQGYGIGRPQPLEVLFPPA